MSTFGDDDGDAAAATAGSAPPSGDATADTETLEAVIERDALFHVLRNERRRRTLRYLLAVDEEPVTMATLAETIAAAECDTTVDALRGDERHRVYTTLYQSHLPQLADAELIEFDRDRGLITRTPHTQAVEPYLDRDGATEREVSRWLWPVLAGMGLGILFMLVVEGVGLTALLAVLALGVATWRSHIDVALPVRPPASR